MTVKQLINKLKEYPEDMPVTISDCIDFTEIDNNNTITVGKYVYSAFPHTPNDTFEYVSLELQDNEYWN